MKHSRICVGLCLAGLLAAAAVQAGPVYVNGLVPNWEQPWYYPDPRVPPYDALGPGPDWAPGANSPFDAWCVPTSTAMLTGHWEDVRGVLVADGSADGNQGPGNFYAGPAWGMGPAWHDYVADGTGASPNSGFAAQRGNRPVNDLAWYVDTNRAGDPLLGNPGGIYAHKGTFYKDVAPGLSNYFVAQASVLAAQTSGVHPVFGGFNVPQLTNMLLAEVNANRTAIAHFSHWNIFGPQGPGNGNGTEQSEYDFDVNPSEFYIWGDATPGGPFDEEWNGDESGEGLGHAVTMVGYWLDPEGLVTHLFVHDNSPNTIRNVAVPLVDQAGNPMPLVAITTVIPEPATCGLLLVGLLVIALRRR